MTSPFDERYNCVAFAAGDMSQWWWPDEAGEAYWPAEVRREASLEAFIRAFRNLGFELCADSALETGAEKIAIFTDRASRPTHVARQLTSGLWASKLGKAEDIEHELAAMEDEPEGPFLYGKMARVLRRSTTTTSTTTTPQTAA